MAKKYVPEGAFLACDKGTSPSTLRVSNNKNTTIYGVPMASELDFIPFFNIKPMGLCTNPLKWATGVSCLPTIVTGWQQPKDGVKINGSRMLLEDSFCDCIFGGKINIFFDRSAAVQFGVGEGKMPTDYIKEGFDWLAEQEKQNRKARDQFLPDWMKPVTGAVDWFNDLGSGLVEGAVNGVVGLGETIYQVGQDPIGTGEALWKMGSDAVDWASKGENWTNMANDSWNWASNGDNWGKAISDGAQWVQKNPRELGNAVGQFIPDAAAAVYSGGSSLGVSAAKVAGKEALEVGTKTALKEGVEVAAKKGAKEAVEEGTEKAAKEIAEEGGEAVAKKTGKELIQSIGDDAADIARVVTRTTDDIQDDIIRQIKNGDLELSSSARKGNFGEMAADRDMMNKGYDPLHERLTDIDAPTHQGIDGVFKDPDPPPKYVVVDAKYGQAGLNTLADGTRQMSDDWIQDRLANTVSRQEMRQMMTNGYERVVAKVDEAGNITYRKVNSDGYIIKGRAGNWP
ncbi:PAAR-like protein [Elizabethkingia anophelis]|uniref:PAAR-like protein n=1 Tax=Elizabethkingia anophelis TaxID=1117645 RepID=UPI0009770F80|nr:PAAR-like protein [Elizabethkingia anophelis]